MVSYEKSVSVTYVSSYYILSVRMWVYKAVTFNYYWPTESHKTVKSGSFIVKEPRQWKCQTKKTESSLHCQLSSAMRAQLVHKNWILKNLHEIGYEKSILMSVNFLANWLSLGHILNFLNIYRFDFFPCWWSNNRP